MGQESRQSGSQYGMDRWTWFFVGMAVGSLVTFMLDPEQGRRRQALVRDKGIRLRNDLRDASSKTYRDFRNRAQGAFARAFQSSPMSVDDEKLMNRVRSEFGRIIKHPRAVHTLVKDGVVTLTGHILADEVQPLIDCILKVSGVKDIIDQLEVHETSKGISSLQGEGPEYLQ